MSVDAYRRVRSIAESPRAVEYRLISEITADMIAARDAGLTGIALMPALHRNRELWSTFSTLCATPGNRLSDELRASIISLGLWVERFTSDVVRGREQIEDLIEVNRTVLEGLSAESQPVAA